MTLHEKLYLALVLFAFAAFTSTVFVLAALDNAARRKVSLRPVVSMPRGAAAHR